MSQGTGTPQLRLLASFAEVLRGDGIDAELDDAEVRVRIDTIDLVICDGDQEGLIYLLAPLTDDWPLVEQADRRVLLSGGEEDIEGSFDSLRLVPDDGDGFLCAFALHPIIDVGDIPRICREFAVSIASLQRRLGWTQEELEPWYMQRRQNFQLALGNLFIARRIAANEAPKRRARMERAIREKERLVHETFGDYLDGIMPVAIEPATLEFLDEATTRKALDERRSKAGDTPHQATCTAVAEFLIAHIEPRMAEELILEHVFAPPFAPYDMDVSGSAHEQAVAELAAIVGAPEELAPTLFNVAVLEGAKHSEIRDLTAARAIGLTASGLALIATAHFAPHAVAAHVGLTGAAAHAHALAVIGMGHGMAAGQMVLHGATKAGYTAVGLGVGGALSLGGKRLVISELTKLQTRAVTLMDDDERQAVIADLRGSVADLRRDLEHELGVSDPGSHRIKEREATMSAVERAIRSIGETEYSGTDELSETLESAKHFVRRGVRDLKRWWGEIDADSESPPTASKDQTA